jgi:lipopolysaccharide biosynthesis regulator YciM
MRVQTLLGILVALVGTIVVAYLTQQNSDLLQQPFRLSEAGTVPVYVVLIAVFLLGFLPVVTRLVVKTLRQDLASRRQRRFEREARSLQASYRRAVDLQEDGQWQRAAAEFETVLANQPEDFGTLLRFGEVLRRQGRVEEAIDVHRRASVLYPQSLAVLYQLADDYEAMGSSEVAREILDRISRDFQGLGLRVLKQRRAAAAAEQEWTLAQRLQEGIESLVDEDESRDLDDAELALRRGLNFERGVNLLAGERFAEATEIFAEILRQSPEFVPARIMLGESCLLSGDTAAAVVEWRQGWQSTGSPTFLQRIEDHFIEREEPLQAIETLRRIIAEAANDLLPRFFLGKLYARLEMHDEALKILGSIRDHVHESPALLCLMGRLHERRGEQDMASQAFRSSLELADLTKDVYRCGGCGADFLHWSARCESCSRWNTIELHFGVEPVASEDLVIRDRPIWPVHGET